MTRLEAVAHLTEHYREQCERYPATCEIPLSLYIARNVRALLRNRNQAYYVAFDQRFSYVRGIHNAYERLAEYLGCNVSDVRDGRKSKNIAGYIKTVTEKEARTIGGIAS